ncbi:DUF4359 domain-containing protein [Limnoraphis robusta Tam1]|uniref:DUF4359 domain-containing protein n=1 Tax=Limnoraphis robusta TaxID=1118279 RepID=UPI002B1FFEDE|nr:DUF4359 domain-containing protein [Limnoraphis robusta]MEA5495699.1 DUF4359 domain-containing protein [Limnoraphis robusta BA-68 BA1]MEA5540120.1 DUF4359 domain-containing protein [Limnoraphis robusta Tam1]
MLGTFDRKKDNSGGFKPNWGDFFGKGAIVLAILAGTMYLTNPEREEYLNYASGRLAAEAKENWCKESNVPDLLSGISGSLVDACQSLLTTQRGTIKKYIDNSTQRQNAVLFSIYTTDLVDHRYQTIGVFGNFLTFSSEDIEDIEEAKPVEPVSK